MDRCGGYKIVLCAGQYSRYGQDIGMYDGCAAFWEFICSNMACDREKKEDDPFVHSDFMQCFVWNRRALLRAVVFAVCDREEIYAERLAQHLKKKQGIPFEILVSDGSILEI